MTPIDLTSTLRAYENKWVALSEDNKLTVYGVGDSALEADRKAESDGYKDYVLMFVRPFDLLYSGPAIK